MSDLYKEAAALLQKLEKRQGGLKSLAYADSVQHKRSSFALVCETLRYKPLLRQLLAAVPQFKFQKKVSDHANAKALLDISLYDLIFGRGKIQGGGHLKKELMLYANAFKEALVRLKIKAKVSTNEDLLPPENRRQELAAPRYVRVNTLLISAKEIEAFMKEFDAKQDDHVRDLLVLPPGTELHEHELVKTGKVVLQDKASCFPAFVLHGEHSDGKYQALPGDVIDACAAPGNKTSHAAMLLHQQMQDKPGTEQAPKVFAFDRSAKRLDLLKRRMNLMGADGIVDAVLQSFLEIDVDDAKFANVRSILLDPSCSGSGMTNRLDHLLDIASSRDKVLEPTMDEYEEDVATRLQSLADFQLEALIKAFSFPQVQRVAYSTCSIFQKENEEVVLAAMNSEVNQQATHPFELHQCLPTWPRRGLAIDGLSEEQAKHLVRANGLEDGTNGFFVAYFERSQVAKKAASCASKSSKKASKPAAKKPTEQKPAEESDNEEEEDEENAEDNASSSKKRKQLSDAQKESRKKRKREKRKAKKGAAAAGAAQ